MGFLLTFALAHLRGILIIVAIGAAGLIIAGLKHSYDEGKRDEGRSEIGADIREVCGEPAKSAADCIAAGKEAVRAEYSTKIETANATIRGQDDALKVANGAVDRMKADSERRQKAASQALAEAESRVQFATQQIAKIETVQPTGATPCESACALLRSSW